MLDGLNKSSSYLVHDNKASRVTEMSEKDAQQ